MDECSLCRAYEEEKSRLVLENEYSFAIIPNTPMCEGHILTLPKKHTIYEDMSGEEHLALAALNGGLIEKLMHFYPNEHPLLVSLTQTKHSSVHGHFHYHLIPSAYNLRKLMATCFPNKIVEHQKLSPSELEQMAQKFR